jgi:glycerophosphoryl diester phosphodiesterase
MTENQKRSDQTEEVPGSEAGPASQPEQRNDPRVGADGPDAEPILLIHLVHHLSAFFMDVRYWEGIQTEKNTFGQLIQTLDRLAERPGHDGTILIRFRGFPSGSRESTKQDYVILFGSTQIDRSTATAVIKRQGLAMSHLAGRLGKAFGIFAEHGIRNLYITIPSEAPAERERFKTALHILTRFPQAAKNDKPIVVEQNGRTITLNAVKDENRQPDPNLSLVAALNRLSIDKMQALVQKVSILIKRGAAGASGEQHTTVYNALFTIDSLKAQLIRPPIEMNNVKWQMVGRGEKVVESDDLSDLDGPTNFEFADELPSVGLPVDDQLGEQADRTDETADNAATVEPVVAFDPRDHDALAAHFDLPVEDVKEIVALVESCFDAQGRFVRRVFEQNIPAFARHEKHVFELLWNYLKGTRTRNDRVAFLSSLQLLISRLEQPKRALKILLSDFCSQPDTVSFSDRNALMLSNLMLRKYNKEVNFEIEITPEEVLMVKEGLNKGVAEYGMWCIEADRMNFLKKMHAIHDQIVVALDPALGKQGSIPLHYLISLEREVYIFLSLVQGETGYLVLREALEVYGNPGNPVYTLPESGSNLQILVQHLRTLLRGFGRVADRSDLDVFDEVSALEAEFKNLGDDPRHQQQVSKVMEWLERIKATIQTAHQ